MICKFQKISDENNELRFEEIILLEMKMRNIYRNQAQNCWDIEEECLCICDGEFHTIDYEALIKLHVEELRCYKIIS